MIYVFCSGDSVTIETQTPKPRKRKRRDEATPIDGEPPAKVLIRQTQKYAKAIRTDAPSDAIQLAAAQAQWIN